MALPLFPDGTGICKVLVFAKGVNGELREKLVEQGREVTTNSAYL